MKIFWVKFPFVREEIIARSASYVRRCSKTHVSVRPFFVLRAENNWFLSRVYEPTTHASVYWDFEIMILTAPEKTSHKVKLRLKVGTLRDRFLNTFGRSFLKNVAKTCRSWLSCQRPGNDQQMSDRLCDVPTTFPEVAFLMILTVPAIRASLPCRVWSSVFFITYVSKVFDFSLPTCTRFFLHVRKVFCT